MKRKLISLILLASSLILGACGGDNPNDDYDEEVFATPLTDALKLEATFDESDIFTEPKDENCAIGEVTIESVTDGDTINFVNGRVDPKTSSETVKPLRFLGINTPESTARVEPWGVKASKFTKSILWDSKNNKQKVYSVVLQNEYQVWGAKESNGRYLGFLWYKLDENSDYRLLNLEIVEQCYSISEINEPSDFCPYVEYFDQAFITARLSGRRVNGEDDPGYDYTNTIVSVSVREVREDYANLGVSSTSSDQSGSGVRLRVTGVIVMFTGNNIVLRDVTNAYENGEFASIYVYTSLTVKDTASRFEVGEIISITCRATTYNDNIQLTDVQDSLTSDKEYDRIVSHIRPSDYDIVYRSAWNDENKVKALKDAVTQLGYTYSLDAYNYVEKIDLIKSSTDLEEYVGKYVISRVTIREGDEQDEVAKNSEKTTDYFRYSENYYVDKDGKETFEGSCTIFAKTLSGAKLNIRSLSFKGYYNHHSFEVDVDGQKVAVGQTFYVIGTIAKYGTTYQISIPNNNSSLKYVGPSYHLGNGDLNNGYRFLEM